MLWERVIVKEEKGRRLGKLYDSGAIGPKRGRQKTDRRMERMWVIEGHAGMQNAKETHDEKKKAAAGRKGKGGRVKEVLKSDDDGRDFEIPIVADTESAVEQERVPLKCKHI